MWCELQADDFPNLSEKIFTTVTNKLDDILLEKIETVSVIPRKIIIKIDGLKIIDIAALEVLVEIKKDCKGKNIKVSFVNVGPKIEIRLRNQDILPAVESKLEKVSKASEEKSSNLSSDFIEVNF